MYTSPGYYAVTFNNGIFAEMTAGLRSGIHHYRFPAAAPKLVVAGLNDRDRVISANMNVSLAVPTNTLVQHRNEWLCA
jgi:putative alpha-1,2-mannosidase